jgi:anti-sigma B factor antagonist
MKSETVLDNNGLKIYINNTYIKKSVIIVEVFGSLGSTESFSFSKILDRCISSNKKIIVDFTHLEYIASTGIGTLIEFAKNVESAGTEYFIAGTHGRVYEAFKLLGFNKLLNFVDNLDDVKKILG